MATSDPIALAILGCGGMGRRHLRGFHALQNSGFNNCRLAAVCDIDRRNAEDLAEEAVALLGYRPRVWLNLDDMLRQHDEIRGVNVTTEVGPHHTLAVACMEAGRDVLVEKPLGLTMRASARIVAAARRTGRILSVGENMRRDPINRLARALIDAGAIGAPHLLIDTKIGGGDHMVYTPWRHQKLGGTIALDEGIHHADLMIYFLGPVVQAFGEGRIVQPMRYRRPGGPARSLHAKWNDRYPETFAATGEDALFGYLRFATGAIGQWIDHHGAHGQPLHKRIIYGSKGSLESQGERNGKPLTLTQAGAPPIEDGRILDAAPDFRLSPLAAQLFGGDRIWRYDLSFDEADWRLIALEHHEFADCIATRAMPEVTGEIGHHALAIIYALFESGVLGRPMTIAEIEQMMVDAYQREIDQHLKLA